MPTGFSLYQIFLKDIATGRNVTLSGGVAIVVANGAFNKQTLYNFVSPYASLANPVAFNNGVLQFAIDQATSPRLVDIYGISPTGHAFILRNAGPETQAEIFIDTSRRDSTLVIPIAAADYTAASETGTGFILPQGILVSPFAAIHVATAQSGKTLSVGLLSSQTGGNATGFANAASVATAGDLPLQSAATATRGAYLGAGTLDHPYATTTNTAANNVSVTPSSGSTTFQASFIAPITIADTVGLLQ